VLARKKKGKKRPDSVLESVFGVKLEAPNPQPEVSPAVAPDPAAVEARANAIAEKRERAAYLATVRVAAAQVAREAGIKHQRAHAFTELLNFSGVGVNSDGEPDSSEIERIVRAGVDAYPEFQTRSLYGSAPGR